MCWFEHDFFKLDPNRCGKITHHEECGVTARVQLGDTARVQLGDTARVQ